MPCGRNKLPCNNQFDAILKSGNKECFEIIYIVSEEDLKIPILSNQASLTLGFIKFLGAVDQTEPNVSDVDLSNEANLKMLLKRY